MRGPNPTGVEFLESDAGRKFAVSLIGRYVAASRRRAARTCNPATREQRFQNAIDDFMDVLAFNEVPLTGDTIRNAVEAVYRQRFEDLYPEDNEDRACSFYLGVAIVGEVLAQLSVNIWLLHRGELGIYPKPKLGAQYDVIHLQWAREAFGWWAASLAKLHYQLLKKPPCKPTDPVSICLEQYVEGALADELSVMPLEMENGCPVC